MQIQQLQSRISFSLAIFMDKWKSGKNVISFGIGNNPSVHVDGRKKNNLVLEVRN